MGKGEGSVKVNELDALVAEMDIDDMLLKPSQLELDVGIWQSYPVPNCKNCLGRCCPHKLDLRLFDIARFMDSGLDRFIEGTFELFMEHSLSILDGGRGVQQPFPCVTSAEGSIYCRFLGKDHKCGIYKARMSSCRAFPLGVVKDKNGNLSLQWFGDQCNIVSDEITFWRLLDNAILNWNEGVKNQLLLLDARDQLRDIGFGKYLGDEQRYIL